MESYIKNLGIKAKNTAPNLAGLTTLEKNNALKAMAAALRKREKEILKANDQDMAAGAEKGLNPSLLDRLLLNEKRIEDM
ncbi:MAG: gamma-glutamyl-phosphate reductase, partial [Clostridiales bacterium]